MLPSIFLFLWLAGESTAAEPQAGLSAVVDASRTIVAARPVGKFPPRYPAMELRSGRQAWVHVTYCIDEHGVTQNVGILESVGNARFDEAAIETVSRWRFEPATIDGQPSWQSRNEVYITFAIEGAEKAGSPGFARRFRRLSELIGEGALEEADALFWETYDQYPMSLYELSKLWAQRVRLEILRDDMVAVDEALRRATASDGLWIDAESYESLMRLRVRVALQLGHYWEAHHAFRKLAKASDEDAEAVVGLGPLMEKLNGLIASDSILSVNGSIRDKAACGFCDTGWKFTPVRSDFGIRDVDGKLEFVVMRCDHKRFESPVSDQVEWHIPETWGTCHVEFRGAPGTTFRVLMFPDG